MGVLTDFVVADFADAQRVGNERQAFDGLDAKGIGPVEMGKLHAILAGTECDPRFLVSDESLTYVASDEGPWVQAIPVDMVRRLAALAPRDLQRVGDEWSKIEEFDPRFSSWDRDDVGHFLEAIQGLAEQALEKRKTLFMWRCL